MAKVNFTAKRVADFKCPPDKAQAFMWDSTAPGLGLRVTPSDARAFVFQSRLDGQTVRMTIGDAKAWTIAKAQNEARCLQGLIDQGKDPRQEKAAQMAQDRAERATAQTEKLRGEVLGTTAWADYCAERRRAWSERNHADHLSFAAHGGQPKKRGKGKTIAGPLYALLARPLAQIDAETVRLWVERESKARPARALLGFRLLRAFLNWCAEHEDFGPLVQPGACKTRKTREALPKMAAKDDALQREQLPAWFAEVRKLSPVVSAYLQALLITGARREELLGLQWADVDFQWGSLTIRDKVEGERTIPLTPYVAHLLAHLPRRNEWVFTSALRLDGQPTSSNGRLQEPRLPHNRALQLAGLPHITLHGLRRSFGTLAEWVECPVGIVAQIQGHKPSAIAEKHYRVRPIDLLRQWHTRIEAWMLEQAGVQFDDKAEPGKLRVISGN